MARPLPAPQDAHAEQRLTSMEAVLVAQLEPGRMHVVAG
jgi:hypothetical protein